MSLWEWGAYVAGWNADNTDADTPPELSPAEADALFDLMERIG